MLTYDLGCSEGPLYLYIYKCIKEDIVAGNLKAGEKLPSKRMFAKNNGISTITIQNAYDQLVSEGYVYALEKKGYYVAQIRGLSFREGREVVSYDIHVPREREEIRYDLSSNETSPENFPFSVWTKVSREVLASQKEDLMRVSPTGGVRKLREAIAGHLRSFRGMRVDPDQIVVGAGTEYLYGLLTQLLGRERSYVIENPGYKKLVQIYGQRGIACRFADMDEQGVTVSGLQASGADVAHICPNHHFPTGITMPASRRYEVLSWANEKSGRYLLEDDYDSEFRVEGKPIPTLFSIDQCEKVVYINTFSKSLSPTIRISYMVLPVHLANRFYETMSFYSCTVSNFEQYTLAQFIEQGYFEKHINRMRLYYMRQRKNIIERIQSSSIAELCEIAENDSGLHFLLKIKAPHSDKGLQEKLRTCGVNLKTLSDYCLCAPEEKGSFFIINYSNLKEETLQAVLEILAGVLQHMKGERI